MARIKFKDSKPQDLTLVLCTRDYRKLGQLTGVTNVRYKDSDNSANVLSFTLTKNNLVAINGNTEDDIKLYQKIKKALWEQVEDFKVVWIKETNEYFEIKVSINDGLGTSKSITATPIPEAELSQVLITAEINTESDIARDDYEITVFFDEQNQNTSLLHRLFQKATGYTIKYVDDSLKRLQRIFSISDSYLYDFLVGECSEQFNCVFKFDSSDRSVSVYDLYTVCKDCGERGDLHVSYNICNDCGEQGIFHKECPNCHSKNILYVQEDKCPKCGSKNLKSYGEDTTIYIDKNNLTDDITCEINTDNVKNCFKLVAGDEYMTATIRNLNPSGSDYIYHIPEYLKKDMSSGLVERLDMYDSLYTSRITEYEQLTEEVYELIDQITYLESGMMPTIENAEVTASTEAEKLTAMNLSPLGLYPFTTSTSPDTVNSALKNYAKVYVKTGYVKLEVESDALYKYVGTDGDGFEYGTWYGRFKVTNYSDEEDVAYSDYITVKVHGNYQEFLEQKVMKQMSQDDEDNSVFDVLSIEELEDFKSALTLYGLNRLASFENAINGALNVLMTEDQASEEADLYAVLYTPYYEKFLACKEEKAVRQSSIDELQTQLDDKERQRTAIQKELDFESFLGEYYMEFSSYRRETVYSNENYICTGLSNVEIIAHAKQFIEVAKEELIKSCEQQITITATLSNLLLIPEFVSLVDKFETGNWLRICVDGVLYRLRLLDYEINYDDLNNLNVTFSNAQKIKEWNVDNEFQSVFESAKSMGQTYGYVSKQADKGGIAQDCIQNWIQNGLNTGLIQITSGAHNEITNDGHGLLCRAFDDISGTYDPKQLRITNNVLAFTSNDWKSCEQIIGEHSYVKYNKDTNAWDSDTGYGMTAKFFTGKNINGVNFVGGHIFSSNYSNGTNGKEKRGTYINLEDGTFSFGGDSLYYRNGEFVLSDTVIGKSLEAIDIKAENLHIDAGNVDGEFVAKTIVGGQIYSLDYQDYKHNPTTHIDLDNGTFNFGDKFVYDDNGLNLFDGNIKGGYLLIGDENKVNNYAEITSDGVLNCNGGNFTGNIVGSSFKVSTVKTYTASDFTSNDVTTLRSILDGQIELTPQYLEKYDFNGDGILSGLDYVMLQNLLTGTTSQIQLNATLEISCDNQQQLLKTDGVSIGINGMFAKVMNSTNSYSKSYRTYDNSGNVLYGDSGFFTSSDGKTVTVTNGIITSIVG